MGANFTHRIKRDLPKESNNNSSLSIHLQLLPKNKIEKQHTSKRVDSDCNKAVRKYKLNISASKVYSLENINKSALYYFYNILCGAKLSVVWYMTVGKVMTCKHFN